MAKAKTAASAPKTDYDPDREAALAAVNRLPATEVERQPSYLGRRVAWMRTLVTLAAKDGAALFDAPLSPPIDAAELAVFPALVTMTAEAADVRDATTGGARLTDDEAALLRELRGHQAKLDRAFRVRLRGDGAGLRALSDIRRGEADDPSDMLSDARRLVALATGDTNRSWIANLKKGEPAAVMALQKAVPALEETVTRLATLGAAGVSRDRFRRVCTLALRTADRVVTAGQYHTSDIPGREGDYKRFARPTSRKARKKA